MSSKLVRIEYEPFESQSKFHKGLEMAKCFAGGWGSGKTLAGAMESLKLCVLNSGADGFIGAPTWNMLHRVTLRTFLQFLPKELIARESKGFRFIELVNGSTIWYGSTDRPYTLEGSNFAWGWLDEARFADRAAFEILMGRLRHPNPRRLQFIFTTTPAHGWLSEEFCTNKEERGLYVGKTTENTKLPPSFIENLRRTLSPQAFKMYCDGEFVVLSGGVFDNFSVETHCQDLQFNPSYPIEMAVDFGYRSGAVIFCQLISRCEKHACTDCIHILDEWMPENHTTLEIAQGIKARLLRKGWMGNKCFVDPAGRGVNVQTGITDINVLEINGFVCVYTMAFENRSIKNGIELMRSKIQSVSGQRSLFVDNSIKNSKRGIVTSLQRTAYKEKFSEGKDPDLPVKDGIYDHARDALRYYLVNKFPVTSYLGGLL